MNIIKYTPDLQLYESHIGTYHVYVLKDPTQNNEIFYVGKTIKELKMRLSGHLSDSGGDTEKGKRIQRILELGSKPEIEAIETIYGTCYIDKIKNLEREHFWIKHYLRNGAPLTNIVGKDGNTSNNEYSAYTHNINNSVFKWHYYYCGKTKYGVRVYDEERMNDDGFYLPSDEEDMTPDELDVIERNITYEQKFDDEHPDYIKSSQEEM